MNPLEHELKYPLGDRLPEAGAAIEVAPGIRWIRMPLPFALDHINLWLLRDRFEGRDGWTIVDCGVARDEVKALWEQVFATQLDGLPVVRVIVTHMHPDHLGLAHWLTEKWGVPLQMSATDFLTAHLFVEGQAISGGERMADHFARNGMADQASLDGVRARTRYYPQLVPQVPAHFNRIMDRDVLRIGGHEWHAIAGYGHAPEHISLYCKELNIVISGDMVLPRISTNVSVTDIDPESNPLQLYLDSLGGYAHVPADALVLPSHGRPFTGIHTRIAQQHAHHADHLARVKEACTGQAASAYDIVPVLFKRKLDLHQMTFALGEAIAHLHMLYYQGVIAREIGADGIVRYRVPA
ncbi:MBL fold metallo-hydrolase [Pigmentiphaga sp.]|uniref:MBL fold metallo-hydrolase n=1 Tax=Pigmentiphaga sp. TaxID=1977564 RepID=UPI00128AF7C6|nr:MBL fold metallo-hydrolase [Pigmentiphaga sp.]MPS27958.1 MBL fold metallo-hydrolase [Alcaligenaceae bacterium SAGV5]MPS51076.1 MBL fold metallo-hydrolase [Alcaligenaceae bacterium SAGV3]MPT59414.1 MBL fold metallo-hydrolase [Alcaligenaceae bacterium]